MTGLHTVGYHRALTSARPQAQVRFSADETPPPPEKKPAPPPEAPKAKPQPGFFMTRWQGITNFVDELLMRDAKSAMVQYIIKDLKDQMAGTTPMTWQVENYYFDKGQRSAYSFVNTQLASRLRNETLEKLELLSRGKDGKPDYPPLSVTLFRTHGGLISLEVNNKLMSMRERRSFSPIGTAANTGWIFRQLQKLDKTDTLPKSDKAKQSLVDDGEREAYVKARTALVKLLGTQATIEKKEIITGDNVPYQGHLRYTMSAVTLPEAIATPLYLPTDAPVSIDVIHGGSSWQVRYQDRSLVSPYSSHLNPKHEWWNRHVKGYGEEALAFSHLENKILTHKG